MGQHTTTPSETFGQRMREARDRAGISQVQLSERLAALGVAPIHLMVPFEDDTVLSEDLADEGVFEAKTSLKVGNLVMVPVVARKWIRGTAIYPDPGPLELWHRYARAHREKLGRWKLPPMEVPIEDRPTEMGPVPDFPSPENGRGFPAPLWLWLMNEKEEEHG